MTSGKGPKRGTAYTASKTSGKTIPPTNMSEKLKHSQMNSKRRRFSLIYSSEDSSLSEVSENDSPRRQERYSKHIRNYGRGAGSLDNSHGKTGKLIKGYAMSSGDTSSTDSSSSDEFQVTRDDEDEKAVDDDEEEEDDDDDDDDDDSSSMTSSDDDVDFVRLTAERKKKALEALKDMKMGRAPARRIRSPVSDKYPASNAIPKAQAGLKSTGKDEEIPASSPKGSNALAFTFKEGDGIQFSGKHSSMEESDEDLGEEVNDDVRQSGKRSTDFKHGNMDHLSVPQFSETEESEYDIDQESYFQTVADDIENATVDTGLETGDDEMAILEEEEKNMVQELQQDDELSFDGSIHEEGEDPVDQETDERQDIMETPVLLGENREDDDYDEELMSEFDMPFYEDPKFANLHYCDGSDQPLSLSTSLPLVLNDEKHRQLERRRDRRRERQERKRRTKQLKREHSATPDLASDDYVFGLFFNSDGENRNIRSSGIDSALRQLNSAAVDYDSGSSEDEEYDNILMDIAHLPTDDDSIEVNDEDLDLAEGSDVEEDDDDDVSDSNIFIDIDDLDPDAFYFHYDSSSDRENSDGKPGDGKDYAFNASDNYIEAVVYIDNESTDEEMLPPPNAGSRSIGTKAKEVVSANTVGLKPPKLGTWSTDTKPFSIIDGLSTKSLLPLIQEHQQLLEAESLQHIVPSDLESERGQEELTLKELLNMSELDDDEDQMSNFGWYESKPKVPLSAFRNKGINVYEDEEYMLPIFSARKFPIGYVGSERTRRKIDKMKELQKKKDEKRRKLRKRKKILKLKRKKALMEKEQALREELNSTNLRSSEDTPKLRELTLEDHHHDNLVLASDSEKPLHMTLELPSIRRGSTRSMNLDDINNLLGSDSAELIADSNADLDIGANDTDILASLTAPIVYEEHNGISTSAAIRRRQSIVEAAAENLRFTKSGLFSESALADLDSIIGNSNGNGHIIELNKVLQ